MQSKIGQTTKQEIIFSCHLGLIKLLEAKLVNYFFFKKKGQATCIAPLQLPTLATFRSWGSSAGAGRTRLTPHKSNTKK